MKAFTTSIRAFLYTEENASWYLKVASIAITCDRGANITRAKIIETIDDIMESQPDVELVFGCVKQPLLFSKITNVTKVKREIPELKSQHMLF